MEDGLEALMLEYRSVSEELRETNKTRESAIGFTFAILGAGVAYGIAKPSYLVLALIPFFLWLVLVYAINQWNLISMLGGYRRALEADINEHVGAEALQWERFCDERGNFGFTNTLASIAFASVWLLSIGVAAWAALMLWPTWVVVSGACALGVLLIPLIIAFRYADASRMRAKTARRPLHERAR